MNNRESIRSAAIAALLVLGSAQMLCDALGFRAGQALAAATLLSPAPRVFSAVRGFETFSARYYLEWEAADGALARVEFDRALYARLRGPYNRRNVYGAAFAYDPVLAADPFGARMLASLGAHAFGGEAPLLRELGLDPTAMGREIRLRCAPRAGAPDPALALLFLRHPLAARP